jgi:hypothetical protein
MREIRQSGLEGGAAQTNAPFLPLYLGMLIMGRFDEAGPSVLKGFGSSIPWALPKAEMTPDLRPF